MITDADIAAAAQAMRATGIAPDINLVQWNELAKVALVARVKHRGRGAHGHRRDPFGKETPTHRVWRCMKERCLNEKHVAYASYGGRGITVCDRWRDFSNFLADMGERPADKTLDRIDNNRGYEPGNCRWATKAEQQRNTRSTRFITVGGERQSVASAADAAGINRYLVYKRLDSGWSPEKALSHIDHRTRDSRVAVA